MDNTNNWLKDLKSEDKVIVESFSCMGTSRRIEKVIKITPKGFIRVTSYNSDELFKPNGDEHAAYSGIGSASLRLVEATAENIQKIEFIEKISHIKSEFRKKTLTNDQWLKIGEILDGD